MDTRVVNVVINIQDMTCSSCELKIENALKKLEGVTKVKVSLSQAKAFIAFDENKIEINDILRTIEELGYNASKQGDAATGNAVKESDKLRVDQVIGIGIIILAIYVIIKQTIGFNFIPEIDQSMGYGILLLVGALTSLHCVAMCGGINLSQCIGYSQTNDSQMSKLKPSLLYNAGRLISYTVIGGIVGAIGSVVSFSGMAKGIVAVLAGVFMIIMGINMLNIFPWLKKFNISMPRFIGQRIYSGKNNSPFFVGLLNGLMPCGPLQSMQLYALGTGSFVKGAASMFFFSLGTVPLMFGLGAASTVLSGKMTNKLMKFSAALVVILGIGMLSQGLSLSGISPVFAASNSNVARIEGGVQIVEIELQPNKYAPIVVQKGIPVEFIINAEQENINGCNNAVVIPQYGVQKELSAGANVIKFLPEQTGTISYSCWMGMIRSSIKIVDDITQINDADMPDASETAEEGIGAGCCGATGAARQISDTPIEEIYVAKPINGVAEVKVTVDGLGYSPNIIVLQKGTKVKFKFDLKEETQCNYAVSFPEYGGGLELNKGELETPEMDVVTDFGFSCWMGMLNGYVKVVDDINNVELESIKREAAQYVPQGGISGCH
ncbi:MAG: hypothetical protein K0R84_303 [Clostridia bacterium]|jgi:sulfite exporter TauE/SafE/plastocyanin domain-containing protein/copper chaperone CopZ|nr:hypothetical protein [Clostridia bacterium]